MNFGTIYARLSDFWQEDCYASSKRAVLIQLCQRQGSAPRDAGSWMLVHSGGFFGSIGGGRLESEALQQAKLMLDAPQSATSVTLDFTLGPASGQCCGGKVQARLELYDAQHSQAQFRLEALHSWLAQQQKKRAQELRSVYLFGAGHVGRALIQAMLPLPFAVRLYDSRAHYLQAAQDLFAQNECAVSYGEQDRLMQDIAQAPAGSAFIIMTHDHNQDFQLTLAALRNQSAAYVGMIGSQTKRAKFLSWLRAQELKPEQLNEYSARLVCPLGARLLGVSEKQARKSENSTLMQTNSDLEPVSDWHKQPSVIAALISAELLAVLGFAQA